MGGGVVTLMPLQRASYSSALICCSCTAIRQPALACISGTNKPMAGCKLAALQSPAMQGGKAAAQKSSAKSDNSWLSHLEHDLEGQQGQYDQLVAVE